MKNKRGLGQEVDWIIGIGLFLVSVMFIIILFRPGVQKVYDSNTLLDILQDGFNNQTEFSITTMPIFLYPSTNAYKSPATLVHLSDKKINLSCNVCKPKDFDGLKNLIKDKNPINIRTYYIQLTKNEGVPAPGNTKIDRNDDNVDDACKKDNNPKNCQQKDPQNLKEARDELKKFSDFFKEGEIPYLNNGTGLTLPAKLLENPDIHSVQPVKTKYLLSVSDRPINFNLLPVQVKNNLVLPTLTACAKEGNADWPHSVKVAAACPVIYELGLSEVVTGIDLASFKSFKEYNEGCTTRGYDCLKQKWKFPLSKEFNIEIKSIPEDQLPNISIKFPDSITPPTNINIFVRKFNTFILTEDGVRIPISVKISTW